MYITFATKEAIESNDDGLFSADCEVCPSIGERIEYHYNRHLDDRPEEKALDSKTWKVVDVVHTFSYVSRYSHHVTVVIEEIPEAK